MMDRGDSERIRNRLRRAKELIRESMEIGCRAMPTHLYDRLLQAETHTGYVAQVMSLNDTEKEI